jgi:hypothetical protein
MPPFAPFAVPNGERIANDCRIHKTLRVTPAMAAGVTDRLWIIQDIAAHCGGCRVKAWKAGRIQEERGNGLQLIGRKSMDFLVEHFTFFGIDFHWWMPIVVRAFVIYLVWFWKTDQISK